MKQSKTSFLTLLVLGIFLALGTVSAMFGGRQSSDPLAFEVQEGTTQTVLVANQTQLATLGQYDTFNSVVALSAPNERKRIRFSHAITLTSHVILTADASIDLNGFTLNLNSFTLTIRHGFYGSTIFENGTIIDPSGQGHVYFETPNSTPVIYNIVNGQQWITVRNFDFVEAASTIFEGVDAILTNGPANQYHYRDLVLPSHYYNSPIAFTYSSNYPGIVNQHGQINTFSIVDEQEVSVTLILDYMQQQLSHTYQIIVVPFANTQKWLTIAANLFVDSIRSNYDENSERYQFSQNTMFIPRNDYLNVTYTYQVLKNDVIQSSIISPGSSLLQVAGTEQDLVLRIKPVYNQSIEITNPVEVMMDFVVPLTKYDLATYVVKETFGTNIFFNDIGVSYSLINLSNFPNAGVVTINYSISQSGYYMINTSANTITSVADASELNIYLNMVFVFDDTTTILRRIRLIFSQIAEFDPFDDYYYEIRQLFQQRTNDFYTYQSFFLPARVELDDVSYLISYSIASAFPTLPSGSQNVLQISFDSANQRYAFTISKNLIPLENTVFAIQISYVLESAPPGTPLTPYGTDLGFVLPGVVRNNSLGIPHAALYQAIELAFNNPIDRAEGLLLKDSLSQSLTLDVSNLSINNFKGLEFLVNLTGLNASNNNFGSLSANLGYIQNLQNLKTLNLSSNNITSFSSLITLRGLTTLNLSNNQISYTNFPDVPNLENLNLSRNRLSTVVTLPFFSKLKTLDLSNNSIPYFYPLEVYTQLQALHIYNNGTYNTTTQTYGTNFTIDALYNKETLIYLNYLRNTQIYSTISGSVPQLTVYSVAEKTQSQVLRGIIYVSTTAGTPPSTSNTAIDRVMAQLPTTIISFGNVSHTVSYTRHLTTMFLSQYVVGGEVKLQRIMLLNI